MWAQFEDLTQHVNFVAVLDLINMGSGYRKALHDMCGRGAWDSIRFGAMGMHISGMTLVAGQLQSMPIDKVAELFGMALAVDKPVDGPNAAFMTLSEPSPLRPLVERLTKVMNETGDILQRGGHASLGAFVLDSARRHFEANGKALAVPIVEDLVATFPAFNDRVTFEGEQIEIHKKAQLLAADLFRHFANDEPVFRFTDLDSLTVFADNVLPTALRALGVLQVDADIVAKIEADRELPSGSDDEALLRGMAVHACERILSTAEAVRQEHIAAAGAEDANGVPLPCDAAVLDFFLFTAGKRPDIRSMKRHSTRDTVFY